MILEQARLKWLQTIGRTDEQIGEGIRKTRRYLASVWYMPTDILKYRVAHAMRGEAAATRLHKELTLKYAKTRDRNDDWYITVQEDYSVFQCPQCGIWHDYGDWRNHDRNPMTDCCPQCRRNKVEMGQAVSIDIRTLDEGVFPHPAPSDIVSFAPEFRVKGIDVQTACAICGKKLEGESHQRFSRSNAMFGVCLVLKPCSCSTNTKGDQ